MGKLLDKLNKDYRFLEGLNACINCGTCTAICPAAEFYKYDPRIIIDTVQSKNEEEIEKLLKSDTIWYCGECMSCVTRCPRKNAPGLIIMALRTLSMDTGLFINSEKGRQQYALSLALNNNILNYGYCVYPRTFKYKDHPEYGPVGKWIENNLDALHKKVGSNLDGQGPGILRKIPDEDLQELKRIFDMTGATERMDTIEKYSLSKAQELGMTKEEYLNYIETTIEIEHHK
jgi:heterodisulfide reductase subunit C